MTRVLALLPSWRQPNDRCRHFAFTEPSGEPAWKTIPSWDLLTLDDHAISPGGQRFMAERAGARISTIRSSHDVMVSHPAVVVDLIVRAAWATRVG